MEGSTWIRTALIDGEQYVCVEDLSRWAITAQVFYEDRGDTVKAGFAGHMVREFEFLRADVA